MQKHDYSISLARVNLISLIVVIPLFVLGVGLFVFIWGWVLLDFGVDALLTRPITSIGVLVGGVIAHELIHGLTWQWLSGEANSVKYGMVWKSLTPYAHITRQIPIEAYAMGTMMPLIVTGILPLIMAYILGSGTLLMIGLLFTWAATGDMVIIWKLRNVTINAIAEDHPTRAGAYVYEQVHEES